MIARIRAALALHESRAQQQVRESIEAEALSDVDRHMDEALAVIGQASVADEAAAWLAGGAR